MSATLLQFPEPPKGNGALEVVRDYFDNIHPARMCARLLLKDEVSEDALPDADYFLAHLYAQGFKVVPVE